MCTVSDVNIKTCADRKRQLLGYSERLSDSFERLNEHLRVSYFLDVKAVTDVTRQVGGELSLANLNATINRADQTVLAAETLLTALKLRKSISKLKNRQFLVSWQFLQFNYKQLV